MKKIVLSIIVFLLVLSNGITKVNAENSESELVYVSQKALSQEEMINIFSKGFTKIISHNNGTSLTKSKETKSVRLLRSGTHSVTTCTQMKKRDYGFIGYSKQCFQETYTAVSETSGSYSISLGFGGISFTFPVDNMGSKGLKGTYALDQDEMTKLKNKTHFSCLRMKGYVTYAKYTSNIYDNASGNLLTSVNFTHTYTYRSNKNAGLDYYLVVRTIPECDAIRKSGYVGTKNEIAYMSKWRNISNPKNASILP